jgi:DNA mismatch repair protein MutS2
MDEHTLELLEFSRVLAELQELCLSEGGRRALAGQSISGDPEEVRRRLELAVAFRALLESGASFPALEFPDIASVIDRPRRVGSLFEPEELAALGTYILSATKLKRHLSRGAKGAEGPAIAPAGSAALAELASAIPDLTAVSALVFRYVDHDGAIKEKSIPELASIRSRIHSIRQDVDAMVSRYLSSPDYRDYWQSDVPTQRNSRTVLPLKASHRGRLRGIVHEVSSSGATIFLEPDSVVEKNNEVVHQEAEYQRVIARVLREIAERVSEHAAEIGPMAEAVSHLDTLYGRAQYAIRHRCVPAQPEASAVELRDARHPLLGHGVVPTSISLGGAGRVVIVTGPNTGGKTVMLKTIGLVAAMNQFGMEIPAGEGSRLGVFDDLLADIGDEQSIEQSLSTFSAHVVNLARIVGASTARSLVLLDELGAGTDPEEGVAIAMALLDHFIDKGCLTCVTTHHGILKNYGYSRAGVRNACMEFDSTEMRPTYRVIMGLPGRSYAIEIARRNGLQEPLVERSIGYLSQERTDVGELIQSLSSKQEELHRRERDQKKAEQELVELRRETDLKALRVKQRERELRAQGLKGLQGFLAESRSKLERVIRELREGGRDAGKSSEARELLRAVEGRVQSEVALLDAAEREEREARVELPAGAGGPIGPGTEVLVGGTGRRGTVIRKARKGSWLVATDTLRAEIPAERLTAVPRREEPLRPTVDVARPASPPPVFQLDLRGQTLEEAVASLELQLERAILAGLAEFSVIHGKGEGVLQRGIHERLRNDPNVEDYFFASPEDGGFGKSIVRLRK